MINVTLHKSSLEQYKSGELHVSDTHPVYIGSLFPFGNRWFNIQDGVAKDLTFEYWDGDQWRAFANHFDTTNGMTSSGYIFWTPNKYHAWVREDTADQFNQRGIEGLVSVNFYDMYWMRVKSSVADVIDCDFIGHMFVGSDAELYAEYPDFASDEFKEAFAEGKQDWQEQRKVATQLVIGELKKYQNLPAENLILTPDNLRYVTVPKLAEVIYNGCGRGFAEHKDAARAEFQRRLTDRIFVTDRNGNARVDRSEAAVTTTRLKI